MYEKPVSRQPSTLHTLNLQRGDSDLLAPTPMFPLTTTAMLPKIRNHVPGGKQPLDELNAYFFTVKPRALDRARAYFSGVVWVDMQDLVIVTKAMGKWVNELGDLTASDLPFTVFETYRQQVGKNLWFPAYSRSDDTFQAGNTSVPIRVIIKWTNFTPQASSPAALIRRRSEENLPTIRDRRSSGIVDPPSRSIFRFVPQRWPFRFFRRLFPKWFSA